MEHSPAMENPVLQKIVQAISDALGDRLRSLLLYGSAARGDFHQRTSDLNLLVVVEELGRSNLEALAPIFKRWRKQGQPFPRLFSSGGLARSADVFPIEFLDIQRHRVVLFGEDPMAELEIHRDHLRLQCERELREKIMRLREGYLESQGSSRALTTLLTDSYTTFVALFRGCLYLLGGEVPVHNQEVVAAFCSRAELDLAPFQDVDRLKRGEKIEPDAKTAFFRYYEEIARAVDRVDRFHPPVPGPD